MSRKIILALCCCMTMLIGAVGCKSSYRLSKDYANHSTFGYLVFVSQSGQAYDDLWVNISGLDKTFLAQTATIEGNEVKGMRYGAQQGKRQVMVRKQNERILFQKVVEIRAGENTIITLND